MTQTFGLIKYGQNETNNLNFRDVLRVLIFLYCTSYGEGWNQLMEDYAIMHPPYCTSSNEFFSTDCRSIVWAWVFFIAWNIISMYIFASLFVSLTYGSFSYIYQPKSVLHAVDQDEIRRFKDIHPDGTGLVSQKDFPPLPGISA